MSQFSCRTSTSTFRDEVLILSDDEDSKITETRVFVMEMGMYLKLQLGLLKDGLAHPPLVFFVSEGIFTRSTNIASLCE